METKMNMIDWYKKVVFQNYANFKGRARRSEYWWYTLANIIISAILLILGRSFGSVFMIIQSIYALFVLVPGIAVTVRRFHDIGKSGWWVVGFYVIILAYYGYMVSTLGMSVLTGDSQSVSPEALQSMGLPMLGLGSLVILVIAIIMLVWLFKDSQPGTNKWGPNPKNPEADKFDFDQQQFHH